MPGQRGAARGLLNQFSAYQSTRSEGTPKLPSSRKTRFDPELDAANDSLREQLASGLVVMHVSFVLVTAVLLLWWQRRATAAASGHR